MHHPHLLHFVEIVFQVNVEREKIFASEQEIPVGETYWEALRKWME